MNLGVNIAGVPFQNPVTTASGTFASGREYGAFASLDRLGAITTKGVSLTPWQGNKPPRIAETYGGMLNAIGLQNDGVEAFVANDLPFLRKAGTRIIVNICGHTIQEYCAVAERLSEETGIDLLELNISCPNVSEGGIAFGTDRDMIEKVVSEVKRNAKQPLIVKLSPNVTDIVLLAKAAEFAGADGLSLINTLVGMKIDINKRKPVLANLIGGLSGPAILPVALRMVYQVARHVSLPIIGMGGISTAEDAIAFLLAGAHAVAIGTANFTNPTATTDIITGIEHHLLSHEIDDVQTLIGAAHLQ